MSETFQSIPSDHFHLGITMAGAVSAGCYTGGAMDYLFEILDLWERAKKNEVEEFKIHFDKIPQHKVIIDVMGGASAGGMTTSMAAIYALSGKINPVNDPTTIGGVRNNIFYDSWVQLDDDDRQKTFAKAWTLDDLKQGKVLSLLNTQFVDNIADHAFNLTGNLKDRLSHLPSYISNDLDLLLSHTSTRGIPMEIDFTTPIAQQRKSVEAPSHSTFEHLIISYYKLNRGEKPANLDEFLWLNPFEKPYADTMLLATKATGAFPIGLRFREFNLKHLTKEYIKNTAERIVFREFGKERGEHEYKLNWKHFTDDFPFVAVDGGAINNEPFGEVLSVLKSRYGDSAGKDIKQYGLIMIDPFPDFIQRHDAYQAPDDLLSMIPSILNTLQEQSKVKRAEMLEAYSSNYMRGVIYPVKWKKKDDKEKYPIACESVSAFGGFLDVNFRHHDFFLGRDNARNFFRFFFTLPYEENNPHPLHKNWTKEMVELFKVKRDGKEFLPIVPDLYLMRERLKGNHPNPYEYSVKDRPVFNPQSLFDLRNKMEDRFEKILELTESKLTSKKAEETSAKVDQLMETYYPKGWFDKVKGWLMDKGISLVFKMTKGGLARSITQAALKWMVKDLEEKELLK